VIQTTLFVFFVKGHPRVGLQLKWRPF